MKKRDFLKTLGMAGLSIPLSINGFNFRKGFNDYFPDSELNEDLFWNEIRKQYILKPEYINLESGYYCILPKSTLDTQISHLKNLNLQGSYYMRTSMEDNLERSRTALAEFLGTTLEETIITRNTTESMDTVICGKDWQNGDEVIMATHDYGAMLDMFKQQSRRYGIVNRMIEVPINPTNDEEIVLAYQSQINSKTKLMLVSHIINITGQILPIRKICDMAHSFGVEVLVDGAHAIGHFEFNISDLNCDYYGASLHKWLSAPLGIGMLYIQKEKIKSIWPLFADSHYQDNDIRKLSHHGTQPVYIEQTLTTAIQFHNAIGGKRKEDRLRFLQNYWTNQVREIKGIHLYTPSDPKRSCAIANVGIDRLDASEMSKKLLNSYQIWTVAINNHGVNGCRITPNVFTSTDELDQLVIALKAMCKS